MSAVRTFKALDYDMKLYGFWPEDLLVVFFVFVIIHGVFNSLVLDFITVGPTLYVAWRLRKRPSQYVSSLISFLATPQRYSVGLLDEDSHK